MSSVSLSCIPPHKCQCNSRMIVLRARFDFKLLFQSELNFLFQVFSISLIWRLEGSSAHSEIGHYSEGVILFCIFLFPLCRFVFVTFALVGISWPTPQECTVVLFVLFIHIHLFTYSFWIIKTKHVIPLDVVQIPSLLKRSKFYIWTEVSVRSSGHWTYRGPCLLMLVPVLAALPAGSICPSEVRIEGMRAGQFMLWVVASVGKEASCYVYNH